MRRQSVRTASVVFATMVATVLGPGMAQAEADHPPQPPPSPTVSLVSASDTGGLADGSSSRLQISGNGEFAVFDSSARDLVPGDGVTHGTEVFEANLETGAITRVSVNTAGGDQNGSSTLPSVSADGTYVAFVSSATNLVPGGSTGKNNVFLRNMSTGITTQVSLTPTGQQPAGFSTRPSISGDGNLIAFDSDALNLTSKRLPKSGYTQIYLKDMSTGTTTLESEGIDDSPGNGDSLRAAISSDGTHLAFVSDATNLTSNDNNGYRNVFERDLTENSTTLISVSDSGGDSNGPSDPSSRPSISADGQFVGFESRATDIVPGVSAQDYQAYLRDSVNDTTALVSVTPSDQPGDASSTRPSVSATGQYVAFESNAHDLVRKDRNHKRDVFVRDMVNGTTTLASVAIGGGGSNGLSLRPSISADGSEVLFASQGSDLVSQGGNGFQQIYLATFG